MKVRRLNEIGQKEFKDFITRTRNDEVLDIPIALLSDAGTSEVITDDLEVDSKKKFNSRYEIGVYLAELLKPIKIDKYLGDSGFWDWFSLFWFDQLCKKNAGLFKPTDLANWSLSDNYLHRARHAIYISWQLVNRYGIDAQFACSKMTDRGEIQEQLMQRQKILGWDGAMRLASAIYSDYAKKGFKKGAASKGAGSSLRYVKFLNQIERTYNIGAMSKEDLLELLPKEYDRFSSHLKAKI
jgi:hypothetical protein